MKITRIKRFFKKNVFNIIFAILVLSGIAMASNMEFETYTAGATTDSSVPDEKYVTEHLYVPSIQEQIEACCGVYNVDTELAVAIAELETGHFGSKAFVAGNNVGGLTVDGEVLTYENVEAGIDSFVSNLAENYIKNGLDKPETMAAKYCPPNKYNWAKAVRELMEEK